MRYALLIFFSIKQRECHSVGITTKSVTIYYTQHTNIQGRQPVCGHDAPTTNVVMSRCFSGYVNIYKDFLVFNFILIFLVKIMYKLFPN